MEMISGIIASYDRYCALFPEYLALSSVRADRYYQQRLTPAAAEAAAASPPDAWLRPANPARGARSGPAYRFYPPRNTNPRAVAFLLWNFSYFCP